MEVTCPKCARKCKLGHCSSRNCDWFVCTKCTGAKCKIVFDLEKHYFVDMSGYDS